MCECQGGKPKTRNESEGRFGRLRWDALPSLCSAAPSTDLDIFG